MKVITQNRESLNYFEKEVYEALKNTNLSGYALLGFSIRENLSPRLHEIDCLIILNPGIFICLEAKNYRGNWTGDANSPWLCNNKQIRASGATNPYQQVRKYSFVVKDKLERNIFEDIRFHVNSFIIAPDDAEISIKGAIVNQFQPKPVIHICNLSQIEQCLGQIKAKEEVAVRFQEIGAEAVVSQILDISQSELESLLDLTSTFQQKNNRYESRDIDDKPEKLLIKNFKLFAWLVTLVILVLVTAGLYGMLKVFLSERFNDSESTVIQDESKRSDIIETPNSSPRELIDPNAIEDSEDKARADSLEYSGQYSTLQELLMQKQWREAHRQTFSEIIKVGDRNNNQKLDITEIATLSCTELNSLDRLWVEYSDRQFGFSVQNEIYTGIFNQASSSKNSDRAWTQFIDAVGWLRSNGSILSYDELIFSQQAPLGHLPAFISWIDPKLERQVRAEALFSRIEICQTRATEDNTEPQNAPALSNVQIDYGKLNYLLWVFWKHSYKIKL